MDIQFRDQAYHRLFVDISYTMGFPREVEWAFRKRVRLIIGALDTRTFYAVKSLHFEQLKGKRAGQYSMRLNKQWRLILSLSQGNAYQSVTVLSITDYH